MLWLGNAKCKLISSDLCDSVASKVSKKLQIPLCGVTSRNFSNKETNVILHESVRGSDVFIFQNSKKSSNDCLVELLIMIYTCKLSSAERITAVMPYMPYSSHKPHSSTHAPRLIANLLHNAGVTQVITLDLELIEAKGVFNIPVENLNIDCILSSWILKNVSNHHEICFVGLRKTDFDRANSLANSLGGGFAIFHETMLINSECPSNNNSCDEFEFIGSIKDRVAIMIEVIATECDLLCSAAENLLLLGAKEVLAVCVHGTFTEAGLDALAKSPISVILTTNSLDQLANLQRLPKLRCLDASDLFASAVERIHNSISSETVMCSGDDDPQCGTSA